MDELAAAAAAASISVDEGTEEEQQLDSTVEAHAAAEVLRAIDANAGGWGTADAPSNFRSTARGVPLCHVF
jgi:hypothetical protein